MDKRNIKKSIEFSDKSVLVFVCLIIVILLVSLLAQWQLFDEFTSNSESKNAEIKSSLGGQITLQIITPPDNPVEKNNEVVNE
ncbi:hypothetical protein J4437_07465 [Candidatus Woesearchaeota archaeon]|nr:hypothetical protein [uncultured archaeon]MBS3124436.1 hypothetical protein [Candidatus Woesearchaeota archaeon]